MTNKIEVKAITKKYNENMTDWKENEFYLQKKFDVYNVTLIFQISTVRTYDGTAETYEEVTQ